MSTEISAFPLVTISEVQNERIYALEKSTCRKWISKNKSTNPVPVHAPLLL